MKLPNLFRALYINFRAFKNNLGKEFEHFKSCDVAGISYFILGTELLGSHYEELLRIVKSYIIDIWKLRKSKLYLVRCSINVDQGGTLHARERVSLVSWEGGSHEVLFMVPFGPPDARPMAQVLRLPFEYYYMNTCIGIA